MSDPNSDDLAGDVTEVTATRRHWKNYPLTAQHKQINLKIDFPADDMTRIKRGVLPREMEDKWFMFFEDDKLYCHRSWTGLCVYVAHFNPQEGGAALSMLELDDTNDLVRGDDAAMVHQFLWLIAVLMFDSRASYPASGSPEKDAIDAWVMAGRAYYKEEDEE